MQWRARCATAQPTTSSRQARQDLDGEGRGVSGRITAISEAAPDVSFADMMRRAGHCPPPQIEKVEGARRFLQAAQDAIVGGRIARTQLQYTVWNANLMQTSASRYELRCATKSHARACRAVCRSAIAYGPSVPEESSSPAMPRPIKARHAEGDAGPGGPFLDLNSHIATKVAILSNRLSRSASRYYRKRYGIGVVEWRLLMFIGQVKETRANRICSETELDKGAVSRSLAVLQRMGLVSAREDGGDSRRNNIALTPKGRALHDEIVPIALDRQSELVAHLTQAEIEVFMDLVERLQAKVSDGEPMSDDALPRPPLPPQPSEHEPRRRKPSVRRAPSRRSARVAQQD
jgi:DNA-binding MarR family transcriptional regulator